MKRAISTLLACLLLCGLVVVPAFADDENTPIILPEDGQPIVLGENLDAETGDLFSYWPQETGWVRFAASEEFSVVVWFYGEPGESGMVYGHGHDNVTSLTMKALEGYPICFQFRQFRQAEAGTVTLLPADPPVLKQTQLKERASIPLEYQPFQEDDYWAIFATINGKPDYEVPGVSYYCSPTLIRTYKAQPGTYTLQFRNYDGEDLGTLTVILEDFTLFPENFSLRGWLEDFLTGLQADWANDDKTTGEWLRSVGKDLLLMFASPAIAFAIFCMGPMGWVFLPVAFLPFTQLFFDIGGLITSIFR